MNIFAIEKSPVALPKGFRIMTRPESTNFVISEKFETNERFALTALPEGEVWHDPKAAND